MFRGNTPDPRVKGRGGGTQVGKLLDIPVFKTQLRPWTHTEIMCNFNRKDNIVTNYKFTLHIPLSIIIKICSGHYVSDINSCIRFGHDRTVQDVPSCV